MYRSVPYRRRRTRDQCVARREIDASRAALDADEMRWLLAVTVTAIGCGASAVTAVDPFVGDWKLNPARSKAIDLMKVENVHGDTYAFDFESSGRETIAVDGTDQRGNGGSTLAVTAEAPDHWQVVRKQAGRVQISASWRLSQDGNTLHDDFTQLAPDGKVAMHVIYIYQRTADGHGFAGTWESPIPTTDIPSAFVQIRPYQANGLSFVLPAFDLIRNVTFDGKDSPLLVHGVAAGPTSSARRIDPHTVEVTEKSGGTVEKTETIELSRDLNTMTRTGHPVGQHGANIYVFERQRQAGRS